MNFKKVVVAVDINEDGPKNLYQLRNLSLLKESEIHLVHVFELSNLSFDFLPASQLSPEDYIMVQKVIEEKLMAIQKDLGLDQNKKVVLKCLFAPNARQEFLNYADKEGATLIVAASKQREGFAGLFESSFTAFLNKFSRSNLLILRPER
jgi:hypothetical protein